MRLNGVDFPKGKTIHYWVTTKAASEHPDAAGDPHAGTRSGMQRHHPGLQQMGTDQRLSRQSSRAQRGARPGSYCRGQRFIRRDRPGTRAVRKNLFGERFAPIVFPENRNFGPACNAGARASKGALLFFLNNDTVLTPGWFPPLRDAFRDNDSLGAVGPLLLYGDKTVQHLGVSFGTIGPFHLYHDFPADHPVVLKDRDLQCITGGRPHDPVGCFQGLRRVL